jgi:glycosyltransferase involved in cell wall biosynthesis
MVDLPGRDAPGTSAGAGGKVCVLIPAWNCASTIAEVVSRVPLRGPSDEIIVVDDASTDGTFERAGGLPRVFVARNPGNLGYGGTSRRLYAIAHERGADVTINIHGDLGHRPEDIPAVLAPILRGEHDIVLGSRLLWILEGLRRTGWRRVFSEDARGGMPLHRVLGHLTLTGVQNLCFGTRLHCFHEGMRACTRPVIEWALRADLPAWYNFDTELLVEAHRRGFHIGEVPVRPLYDPRTKSAAPPIRYGLRTLAHAIRKGLERL